MPFYKLRQTFRRPHAALFAILFPLIIRIERRKQTADRHHQQQPRPENSHPLVLRQPEHHRLIHAHTGRLAELRFARVGLPGQRRAQEALFDVFLRLVRANVQRHHARRRILARRVDVQRKDRRAVLLQNLRLGQRFLIRQHRLTLVSIGNGTASRETVEFVEEVKRLHPGLDFTHVVVSEAGASVYSASELAAAEFPDLDVSYRGAVSIARRLQDPLAELVKIEPKAIGVGQYQHDVDQQKLAHRLDAVVEDCVNAVGVDVNTASSALLCRVAGLSPARANAIVSFRSANGAFRTRRDLLAVPRLGAKTFEQAAGFLRIPDGDDPLDASAVHPEAYPVVLRILKKTGLDIKALIGNAAVLRSLHARDFVDEHFGIPTVTDILGELLKPGRDPRPEFRTAKFADGIKEMKDLQPGMVLEGVVTNVAAFGAFVDVGVHQDGLVHISHLADRRVSDPRDVVKVGDIVKVRVLEVDLARQRISLSMRSEGARRQAPAARRDTRSAAPSQGAMAAAFAKLRR